MGTFIKKYSWIILLGGVALYYIGRYLYFQPKMIQGENLPSISGELLNGNAFQLSELRGEYVLVDFWGSWCAPCLKEIPGLKMLHNKYKDAAFQDAKGFEIVSIAIERDKKRWVRAVERTGMNWEFHLLDLATNFRFLNSPLAQEFGVKEVPTKFLLNKDGVIIGVNQSIEELDAFLEKKKI